MIKRFKFPIRTTDEGAADIKGGVQAVEVDVSRIKEQGLYTQIFNGVKLSVPG
jgi:hypothetical protein